MKYSAGEHRPLDRPPTRQPLSAKDTIGRSPTLICAIVAICQPLAQSSHPSTARSTLKMLGWVNSLLAKVARLTNGDGRAGTDSQAHLLRLPPELLLHIVDFLEASDAALLSLCNHDLCRALGGASSWTSLTAEHGLRDQRQRFLLRLARDHPKYFYCHTCSTLHLTACVGQARDLDFQSPPLPYWLRCLCDFRSAAGLRRCFETHWDGSGTYDFLFPHLQLAMMRHHQGAPYGQLLATLAIREIQELSEEPGEPTTLLSVEPMIVSDQLFLRVQQCITISLTVFRSEMERSWYISICTHATRHHREFRADLLRCKLEHQSQRDPACATCAPFTRCSKCDIEFTTSVHPLGDEASVIVVTKWLDLGRGETPEDPKWQRNLCPWVYGGDSTLVGAQTANSTSLAFEASAKSMRALTDEHLDLMRRLHTTTADNF